MNPMVARVSSKRLKKTGAWFRRFRVDTAGAALVETTLMMPFLLMLSAGVFEFGNLFYQRLLLHAGVRDAARYAARCPQVSGISFDCSDTKAKYVAVYGDPNGPDGGNNSRVANWGIEQVDINRQTTTNNFDSASGTYDYRGGPSITTIRVSTSWPYTGTGLLQYIGFGSIDLNVVHEERYIGW